MQYFSGRFKEKASDLILDFHSTIKFEERMAYYDIMAVSYTHLDVYKRQELKKSNISFISFSFKLKNNGRFFKKFIFSIKYYHLCFYYIICKCCTSNINFKNNRL